MVLYSSGVDALINDRALTTAPGYERITQIGVKGTIYIQSTASIVWDLYYALTGYGFLTIMHYIDTIWGVWSWGKYYTPSDVRGHFLARRNGRAYIEESTSFFRWERLWNRAQLPIRMPTNGAIYVPPKTRRGLSLTRYMINCHTKQGFGLWWFPFMVFIYYWLAYPWWNHLEFLKVFHRPIVDPIWFVYYLLTACGLYFTTGTLRYPQQLITTILFPVYVTLYPLVWLFGKAWNPQIKIKL